MKKLQYRVISVENIESIDNNQSSSYVKSCMIEDQFSKEILNIDNSTNELYLKILEKIDNYDLIENDEFSLKEEVSIEVTFQPFKIGFHRDDFDSEEEFVEFIDKLKTDELFAYKMFFNNFEPDDIDAMLSHQNEEEWKIEIK